MRYNELLDNPDELEKWRREQDRKEETARKRKQRDEAESDAIAQLRVEMQAAIADLRAEVHRLHEAALEAAGQTIGEFSNKTRDHAEKMIREVQTLLAQRFGELQGRLDVVLTDPRARPRPVKDFRFSNEQRDDDVTDPPDPSRKVN